MKLDVVARWVPRHHWVRVTVGWMPDRERGRGWLYARIIRRDAWTAGPLGLVVMRMPR